MDSILNVRNASRILTLSAGTFAGVSFGLSLVSVPAILASNDPLPVWRMVYKRGSKIAVSALLTSTLAGTYCFFKNGAVLGNAGYLACGALSFSIIPYTLIFMKPINDHLFSLDRNEESKTVKGIVEKWGCYQWVRTITGLVVFGLQVFQIGQL